jgi:hypothetical protein
MKKKDNSFYALSWFAFILSTSGYLIGILRLENDIQTKGFFSMAYFFAIFAAFTLAKTIRDRQDADDKLQ